MSDNRETVGKIHSELIQKTPDSLNPIDLMREQLTDYDKEFYICLESALKKYPDDFYIVILTKKERLMEKVLRNYFFSRSTCPTPEWDQSVHKYHRKDERIEFLWVIPSKDTCNYLAMHALEVVDEEKELLKYVLQFRDGTLLEKAKLLNKEIIIQ